MSLSRRTHSHTRRELKNTTETTDSHTLCGVQARETSRVLRSAASQLAAALPPPEGPAPRSACLDFSPRSPQECARDRLCERAPAVCVPKRSKSRDEHVPQKADDDRRARPFPSPPSAAPPPGPQTDVVPHRPARVGSDPMLRWSPAASRHSRKRSKTTSKRHRGITAGGAARSHSQDRAPPPALPTCGISAHAGPVRVGEAGSMSK